MACQEGQQTSASILLMAFGRSCTLHSPLAETNHQPMTHTHVAWWVPKPDMFTIATAFQILTRPWVTQPSILAHPAVSLFVTHGK
jgi:hypothetical protein